MAAQPQPGPTAPAAQPPFPRYPPGFWPPSRLAMVLACALFIVSALTFAFTGIHDAIGPGFAWLAGGFAGLALSWALP